MASPKTGRTFLYKRGTAIVQSDTKLMKVRGVLVIPRAQGSSSENTLRNDAGDFWRDLKPKTIFDSVAENEKPQKIRDDDEP